MTQDDNCFDGESGRHRHLVLYPARRVLDHKGRALYRESDLAAGHGLDDSSGHPSGRKVDYLVRNHPHTGHDPTLPLAFSGRAACLHHSRVAVARMRWMYDGGGRVTCVYLVVG